MPLLGQWLIKIKLDVVNNAKWAKWEASVYVETTSPHLHAPPVPLIAPTAHCKLLQNSFLQCQQSIPNHAAICLEACDTTTCTFGGRCAFEGIKCASGCTHCYFHRTHAHSELLQHSFPRCQPLSETLSLCLSLTHTNTPYEISCPHSTCAPSHQPQFSFWHPASPPS